MFTLTDEQINKAIEWWANRVCAPVFNGLTQQERQDPANASYQLAEAFATMLTKPVQNDQREEFIVALKNELSSPEYNPHWGLHVDYAPCRELADAATLSGVPSSNFPWKTDMYFKDDGGVYAKTGYGAEYEKL